MTSLCWSLFVLCAAGRHLSASPVLRPALVVPAGHNVSLSCNLTSSGEIVWYFLRSEELLPLLTVVSGKLGVETVSNHPDFPRVAHSGRLDGGSVSLQVLQVEQQDAGLYFCTGRCHGAACVDRGTHLVVDGAGRDSSRLPCWSLGICVLPAFLVLCLIFMVGFYLCSGKPAVCCCNSARGGRSLQVKEEVTLHYSSLKHMDKPRPTGQGGTGLVEDNVTYSAVTSRKSPSGSHDHR